MTKRGGVHRWAIGTVAVLALVGCGGGSSVTVGSPGNNQGPVISGRVSMPNGQLAAAPSAIEWLAAAVVARVEALVAANVRPVGGGVEVTLLQIDEGNIVDGQIRGGRALFHATTDSDGVYAVRLPTGTDPNTCRFLLEVGSAAKHTLTRAFVAGSVTDIDFQSETAVRLLLEQIKAHATQLCMLDANGIASVTDAVRASSSPVFGDSAAAVNDSAEVAGGNDPGVQAAIAQAIGVPTPPPTETATAELSATPAATSTATAGPPTPTAAATNTAAPSRTASNTPNASVPPTRTATSMPVPSRTPTSTATAASPTPVASSTRTATITATRTPTGTVTPIASNTISVTATVTAPPTGTATAAATVTATASAATSPVATNTAPTPATETASPTATGTGLSTATATALPTGTATATIAETPTNAATQTSTPSIEETATPTGTAAATATATRTQAVSSTVTNTPGSAATATGSATVTRTASAAMTITPANTATRTSTVASTPMATPTITPANTATRTSTVASTPMATATITPANTATRTNTVASTPTTTGTRTTTPTPSASPTSAISCRVSQGRYTEDTGNGVLKVSTFLPFPFPPHSITIQDVSAPDANCVSTTVIPYPGGLSVPVFCIPALGYTTQVTQTGCGIGVIDSDGGSDLTTDERGDTSFESGSCHTTQSCSSFVDSSGELTVKVGDGITDSCPGGGTGNAMVSIPVNTVTWLSANGCPDPDGDPNGDDDTIITQFPQTLDLTTDRSTAEFGDNDGDGCSQRGAGPAGPFTTSALCAGAGSPYACCTGAGMGTCTGTGGTGLCIDFDAQTVTVAGGGTVFSSAAPLHDLLFTSIQPAAIAGPTAFVGATCASPPLIDFAGSVQRCIVAP